MSSSTIFFHIISQTAQFSGKKLLNVQCVFWFSLQVLSEAFLILIIIWRDIFINVHTSSCKVEIIIKLKFYQQIFDKFSNWEFYKNPSGWSQFVPCRLTDRQTHMMKLSLFAILWTYLKWVQLPFYCPLLFHSTYVDNFTLPSPTIVHVSIKQVQAVKHNVITDDCPPSSMWWY